MTDPLLNPTASDLLQDLAAYAGTIPGIRTGLYPVVAAPRPDQLPAIALFSGSDREMWQIEDDADGCMVTMEFAGQLMVKTIGNTPVEHWAADTLLYPILRAFAVRLDTMRNPAIDAIQVPGLQVDYLRLYGLQPGSVTYAGQQYVGASMFFRLKVHLYPGVTP